MRNLKKAMIYKEKIIRWWENRKRKKVFKLTRETMMLFGCDLSHLTEQEIEERLFEACKIIQSSGITVAQAAERLTIAK